MKYKYIYGPVPSWRLGSSLGIDLLSCEDKICTFDCIYCQIGKRSRYTIERGVYVPKEAVIQELKSLPADCKIDYITFSGRGEPTLAENLGEAINAVKALQKGAVAVITNSSLMDKKEIRLELSQADFVIAKLDGASQKSVELINKPASGIGFESIFNSLVEFRREYKGKLAIQIMFIDENKEPAAKLAELCAKIKPDEVQINTPLRHCGVKPLSREKILMIEGYFKGMRVVSVYGAELKGVSPLNQEDTLKRRGKI
jgi:wyosine [tRNA(Phe)-imidazoG37] synthetase (radical SAM superfamily)